MRFIEPKQVCPCLAHKGHPSVIAMDKMIDAVQAVLAIEDEEERNGILGLVAKNTGWHITLEPVTASSAA